MVHVQLRPIFIGGPSVQLGQLHLIEKLNLYEALQMKRSGRKINTFKCNSTPIFWLSPAALATFGASPWLLYLGCDDKLSQYRFSNWPFWLFCALPVSIQAHIVTILVKKWMHEVKCYFSFTLQMGLYRVPAEFTVFFDVAAIIKLYSFHMAQMYPGVILLSLYGICLAKSSCLRSIKAWKSFLWLICALQPTIFMLLQS